MGVSRLPDGRRIRWLGVSKAHEMFTHEQIGTVNVLPGRWTPLEPKKFIELAWGKYAGHRGEFLEGAT